MRFPLFSKPQEETKARQRRKLKSLDDRKKDWAHKRMLGLIQGNPGLERAYIGKLLGMELPEPEDPLEAAKQKALVKALEEDPEFQESAKQEYLASMNPSSGNGEMADELEGAISGAVVEKIRSNPKLVEEIVEQRIEGLMRGEKSSYRGRTSDLMREIVGLRELKEVLREEEPSGRSWLNPELITAVLGLLPALLGKGVVSKAYVVETPEGTKEFTPEQYKLYLEQRQRGELPAPSSRVLESPGPTILSPSTNQVQIIPSPPFAPPSAPSLNIGSWVPYLEQEPEIFATLLEEMALVDGSEGERAKFTLNILKTKTTEELLALLQPFKARGGETSQAIEALEAKKEWLEELIEIVKKEDARA